MNGKMSSPAFQIRSGRIRAAAAPGRVTGLAGAALQRARLTVVPRARTRTSALPFVTLVSFVLLAGVIGLLMFNTSMQQAAFAATTMEQQAATLNAREQTLRMELDTLRDPQRVGVQGAGDGHGHPGHAGVPPARRRQGPRHAGPGDARQRRCGCCPVRPRSPPSWTRPRTSSRSSPSRRTPARETASSTTPG